ncbi:MAG: DUF4249 domain-containing protein [Bacteroidota bacterium]
MEKKLQVIPFSMLVLIVFFFSSCEREVQVAAAEAAEQKLAVVCNFSPDEPFLIELTKSQKLFGENKNDLVEGAQVTLFADNQLSETILPSPTSTSSKGKYESETITPVADEFYTLKIAVPGVAPITATSSIPKPIEIAHFAVGAVNEFEPNEENFIQEYEVRLSFQFADPEGEDNYYQVNFYQEVESRSNSGGSNVIKEIIPSFGYSWIDERLTTNFNLIDGGLLFRDFTFDGTTQDFLFQPLFRYNFANYKKPDRIIIQLRTVSEEYYQYYTSVYRQQSQGNVPFTDPVDIFSNIEGGHGVFAGFSKDEVRQAIEF